MLHLLPRLQKEEAKIAAWENLQKAKAEAAVRKLEVNICKCCNDVPYISMFQGVRFPQFEGFVYF